jgi:ABC-type dipeptide/oligopeptide/nickel transport system permease subunit
LRLDRSWSGRIGLALTLSVILIVVFGPLFAPDPPTALAGPPFATPSSAFPLGTDELGRDVLSRLLWGGRSVVGYALAATSLAYIVGAMIGLVAGYSRSIVDPILMRAVDVMLAFPPFLLLLVLTTGLGTNPAVLILGVMSIHVPAIARILRSATLEMRHRGFVEAAVARGERRWAILGREILPNIAGTVVADAGPRLTISILLVASLNFLGLGVQPPNADWALMISENRPGLTVQPWSVIAPALLIILLTIGTNLLADAVARAQGMSIDEELVRR